jgi:hypothetical protein
MSFKNKFNVTHYALLPKDQFDDAIKWIQKQIAINRQKLRKPDNEKWKTQIYSSIWAKARERGMDKPQVYDYAEKVLSLKKPISSLKELSDTRLKKLYTKLYGK